MEGSLFCVLFGDCKKNIDQERSELGSIWIIRVVFLGVSLLLFFGYCGLVVVYLTLRKHRGQCSGCCWPGCCHVRFGSFILRLKMMIEFIASSRIALLYGKVPIVRSLESNRSSFIIAKILKE